MDGVNKSDAVLKEYFDKHVKYEIDMFLWNSLVLQNIEIEEVNGYHWALRNSVLNSFSIHTRNLISFLYPIARVNKTDIVIQDYIEERDNKYLLPITELLKEAYKKANKQVAHLTWNRISYEENGKYWKYVKIRKEISKVLSTILPSIPSSRLSEQTKNQLINTLSHSHNISQRYTLYLCLHTPSSASSVANSA